MLGHTSSGGTVRVRKLAKERLVNAGTVVGLDEQLMQAPYKCTYTTASFVHLYFFDKTQVTTTVSPACALLALLAGSLFRSPRCASMNNGLEFIVCGCCWHISGLPAVSGLCPVQ